MHEWNFNVKKLQQAYLDLYSYVTTVR